MPTRSPTTSNISRPRRASIERHDPMVQLTLPKTSRVIAGKSWPKPTGGRIRELRIYRFDQDDSANTRLDSYFIVLDVCGPMVLGELIMIKSAIVSTMYFRIT